MIRELDAINVLRAHIEDARNGMKEATTLAGLSAATTAACALIRLARELSESSDMPAEFLRRVGVQS